MRPSPSLVPGPLLATELESLHPMSLRQLALDAVTDVVLADGYNPFNITKPTFGPFTELLGPKVGTLLGVVWAGAFCVAAFYLIEGVTRMGKARRVGSYEAYEEAKSGVGWPIVSIIVLSILPFLFGALAG